ncbi:MAG: E3 binding domain-containing protein, partial [Candidatus Aenigmarchaeota archaeon]|nr:E3 binding domain-containing protein [Candidatus Aenigmarchaeota archaeon]
MANYENKESDKLLEEARQSLEEEERKEKLEKKSHEPSPSILATPATRRLAKNLGVNMEEVKCTGAGGRITEEDVRQHAGREEVNSIDKHEASKEMKVMKKYDMFGYIEHVPLKGIRKATAKRMTKSLYTATHVTHMDEADVTHLWNIREKEKKKF